MRSLTLALCVLLWVGCGSRRVHIAPMSDLEYQELVIAGNEFAMNGQPVPKAIQKLRPVRVYYFRSNVIIAIRRDAHEERGYYIVPLASSNHPRFGQDPEWTLKPLDIPGMYSGTLFEYCRKM